MSIFEQTWGTLKDGSDPDFDADFERSEGDDGNRSEADDIGYKEPEMQAEMGVVDRVSYNDACSSGTYNIPKGSSLTDIQKIMLKEIPEPLERFKTIVGAVSHKITENKLIKVDGKYSVTITNQDRDILCNLANNIEDVKYLNPTAYLLGYIVTEGGKVINKSLIKKVFQHLQNIDESIQPADVVRYARFFLKPNIQVLLL
jgi:hypothetical protein